VTRKPTQQDRLRALTDICLALPETRREDKASRAAFLVAKKTFAYYLNEHHGDNIVSEVPFAEAYFSSSNSFSPSPGARKRLASTPCWRVYKSW
jgi:hypothetical protein